MNVLTYCNDHPLFVMSVLAEGIVVDVGIEGSRKVTSQCLDDCLTSACVPLVRPRVQEHHGLCFSVGYHHYLSSKQCTFRPEPPAVMLWAPSRCI